MPAGSLQLTDSTLAAMLNGTLLPLETSAIAAVLLAPNYVPDLTQHAQFSDVSPFEINASDVSRVPVAGGTVAGTIFRSDDLIFGDPVTLGPAKYVAFVYGLPLALAPASWLMGVADLSPDGGAVEAQRSQFSISCPAGGWFQLTRA